MAGEASYSRWALLGRSAFVLFAVAALGLGYEGLREHLQNVDPAQVRFRQGFGDIVYYDLQLFVLDSPPVEEGRSLPLSLQVARFLAPLATAYALSTTAYGLLADRIRVTRARRSFGHTIVCGIDAASTFVTKRLIDHRQKVVVVVPPAQDHLVSLPRGVLRVVGDATDRDVLRRAGVDHAREVMAVSDDDVFNAEVANAIETSAPAEWWWKRLLDRPSSRWLVCFVEIEDRSAVAELAAMALAGRRPDRSGLEFFSRHDRAARRILDRWPLLRVGADGSGPALLVIGAGPLGEALVTEALRRWRHNSPATPVRIRVAADRESAGAMARRVGGSAALDWRPIEFPVTSAAEITVGEAAPCAPTHIFVCSDVDAVGYRFGRNLVDACPAETAVVVAAGQSLVFGNRDPADERPAIYNVTEAVYAPDSVRQGDVEDIAQAIHQAYLATVDDTPSAVPWEELPPDKQEDNREQARDIGRKLAAIGCVAVPSDPTNAPFVYREGEIEPLAFMEHERWMSRRLANGWRYAKERDDQKRCHPDLVPWDKLTQESRNKDLDTIRQLPEHLGAAGFSIVRRPRGIS